MRRPIVISFMALSAVVCMVTACGASSEAEETTAEEIIEETSEAEIEEDIEVIEAESEEVEEVTEEESTETEETTVKDIEDETLREMLDPDTHMDFSNYTGYKLPATEIVFDETAQEGIQILADTYTSYYITGYDEAEDAVATWAGRYYRSLISKDDYYRALVDMAYGQELLDQIANGTYTENTNSNNNTTEQTGTSTGDNNGGSSNGGTDATDTGSSGSNDTGTSSSNSNIDDTSTGTWNVGGQTYTNEEDAAAALNNMFGGDNSIESNGTHTDTEGKTITN